MPEIKHQFTGGKMNKDVDERLVPNGQYRDAMNIQVATSEGSDVGTIQNILGNKLGCQTDGSGGAVEIIQPESFTVSSVSDEKNDTLYWLIAGPNNMEVELDVEETSSAKDMIFRKNSNSVCRPVFVDKYRFCVGLDNLSGVGNSITMPQDSFYDQITTGMTATGYGSGNNLFDPTLVTGIGSINMFPVNYTSIFTTTSVSPNIPNLVLSDADNTAMYQRGFYDDTTGKYTNIHYDDSVDTTFAPFTQTNLPPNGASQFWVPYAMIPLQHGIVPGDTIQQVFPQYYHAFNQGFNALNGAFNISIYNIVIGNIVDQNSNNNLAWIITVGVPGGQYDNGMNRCHYCWSDSDGNKYGCNWYTGIGQKVAAMTAGFQNAEAFPFFELGGTFNIAGTPVYTYTSTNAISISSSGSWADEVYNTLYDINGALTGAQISILIQGAPGGGMGAGYNFPPNSCIDPSSVSPPVGGVYDMDFVIMDCTTEIPLPPGVISMPGANYYQLGIVPPQLIYFQILGNALNAVILNEDVDFDGVDTICFEAERILNFDKNRLINSIDIVDGMLLWTDNKNEPKKINIARSIQGTDSTGEIHTAVINQDAGYNLNYYKPIREEHVTVIKKSPKNALNLELYNGRDSSLDYSGYTTVYSNQATGALLTSIESSSNPTVTGNFSSINIGDTVTFEINGVLNPSNPGNPINLAWEQGGYLLLEEYGSGSQPPLPLANWTIRGKITNHANNNNFDGTISTPVLVEIEIVALKGIPSNPVSSNSLNYVVDYENNDPVIFKDKFPRFSYRYKYEDGEYSTFAPWSNVAFLPTSFNYEPKTGFNKGMLNNIKYLKVKGFQPSIGYSSTTGLDVVEVDILYKEDSSPNIYIVQTISPIDILPVGSPGLPWFLNEYTIDSEEIKSTLPSNQLLRSWDNVPRKALAQSISGSRIIYANYVQNYNLKINNKNYKPDFKNSLASWGNVISGQPEKSIKSLRDYKLGVVFTDEYGRETPVLISESGGFGVEKKDSINANRLRVGLKGDVPKNMTYYKFYLKETSSEYYNLSMDRWYNAEDGNLWLAFPSSDRNKVDLETSLYFKKGDDNDDNIIENSTTYKILAIENEAPDFIKTRKVAIGSVLNNNTSNPIFDNIPRVNAISFSMKFMSGFNGTSLSSLDEITEELHVQFVSSTDKSRQYKISEITSDRDVTSAAANNIPSLYFITLDTILSDDINFILSNPNSSTSTVFDGVRVVFTKSFIENKPKFDGRFFAKIENDGKIKTQINDADFGTNYIETVFKKVYALDHDNSLKSVSTAAVTTPDRNYVTTDYSGTITGGLSAQQIENPNGRNWQYLAARASYFSRGIDNRSDDHNLQTFDPEAQIGSYSSLDEFDARYHIDRLFYPNSNVDNPVNGQLTIEKKFNGLGSSGSFQEVSGVWFIDRSTKKYKIDVAATGGDDNAMRWDNSGNMNAVAHPNCSYASACGYNGVTGEVGGGIKNFTNSSKIHLGFGGFGGIKGWSLNADNTCAMNWWSLPLKDEYFGVGTTNTNWNDLETSKFVEAIDAGFKFRWREDPTETIYTVSSQISYTRNLRFGRYDDSICLNTANLIGAQSSYTKGFSYNVTPSMSDWDPAGEIGVPMVKGLLLGEGVPVNPSPLVNSVATGDSLLVFNISEDLSDIKVGMSVGNNTNIDDLAKVIDVDLISNQVTIDIGATGGITVGTAIDFRFSIRVVEEYMYNDNTSTGANPNDPQTNYLIVDSIETECARGNDLKPIYALHKGMALQSMNIDSTVVLADHVCIKNIEDYTADPTTSAPRWKLTMAGHYAPLHTVYGAGWVVSSGWTLNSRISFQQVPMNGASNFTEENTDTCQVNGPLSYGSLPLGPITAIGYDMMIMEAIDDYGDGESFPENPFIWETEPKEDTALDVYYEISENNPTTLSTKTIELVIPITSKVANLSGEGGTWNGVLVTYNGWASGQEISLSERMWIGPGTAPDGTPPIIVGSILQITKPNGIIFSVEVEGWTVDPTTPNVSNQFKIINSLHNSNYTLNWHNCYSFGNGVESNRIKDTFNSPFISNGVKVSTTIGDNYKEERRRSGLIYSGLYNSTSGVNNLNQFIAAEKITKDINPVYGSIQKLHSRSTADGDLIALCEDRVLKILAEKDALFNADGNPQLVATDKVLGQATPFSGDYGISENPESFASESYRLYFTDKTRGAVIRLSKDGLTPISSYGMKDWFKDNLKLNDVLVGSYDDKKNEYNISLKETTEGASKTVSFREDSKGWVSFKSYITENAISCANEYYTFKNGKLWLHNVEQFDPLTYTEINRNTFYGIHNSNHYSTFTAVLNDAPGSVKSFKTLNYEGSQARVLENIDASTSLTVADGEYYNLTGIDGWFVDAPRTGVPAAETNLEKGSVNEFVEKEGKWFASFIGTDANVNAHHGTVTGFRSSDFSVQGLGTLVSLDGIVISGCTDPTSFNYDSSANTDDGSCIATVYGCTNQAASNYDGLANTDNGSCTIPGCTDPTSFNYMLTANVDDGSCIATVLGCIDATQFNYNVLANTDDGSCIAFSSGCTDPTAFNYDANINTDDGSCVPFLTGCMDPTATNYNSLANVVGGCIYPTFGCTNPASPNYNIGATVDDGSCVILGCDDINADNYDVTVTVNDGSCVVPGCTDVSASNYNVAATYDDGSCLGAAFYGCMDPTAFNFNPNVNIADGSCIYMGCTNSLANNFDTNANTDDGSCTYDLGCTDSTATNFDATATTDDGSCLYSVPGCTDSQANNFDPSATTDDGSCTYSSSLLIGDYYQGGIIFQLDGSGGGFVAAVQDQAAAPWGCDGSTIPGAGGVSLGTGAQNTIDIIQGCAELGIPARLSDSYSVTDAVTGVTYSDWFLPAPVAAVKMHDNIGLGVYLSAGSYPNMTYPVNSAGVSTYNIGNFTAGIKHWTSCEGNTPFGQFQLAITVNQDIGTVVTTPKDEVWASRPIRSF